MTRKNVPSGKSLSRLRGAVKHSDCYNLANSSAEDGGRAASSGDSRAADRRFPIIPPKEHKPIFGPLRGGDGERIRHERNKTQDFRPALFDRRDFIDGDNLHAAFRSRHMRLKNEPSMGKIQFPSERFPPAQEVGHPLFQDMFVRIEQRFHERERSCGRDPASARYPPCHRRLQLRRHSIKSGPRSVPFVKTVPLSGSICLAPWRAALPKPGVMSI